MSHKFYHIVQMKINAASHGQLQHEILRLAVPDIGSFDMVGGGNYSNLRDFELYLFHISSSQWCNQEYFPSTIALHILMTLATRIPDINWSKTGHDHEFMKLDIDRELPIGYDAIISLKDKSHDILSRYLSRLMERFMTHKTLENCPLFNELRLIFQHILSTELPKRRVRPKRRLDSQLPKSDPTVISLVSDSEEDILLESRRERPRVSNLGDTPSPTKDWGAVDHAINKLTNIPKKSKTKKKQENLGLDSIRIFDDHLITYKLNPVLNNGYSIWQLIEWCFWSAKQSRINNSNQREDFMDSFHQLYVNYKQFLNWLFEFLDLDLMNTIQPQLENLKPEKCPDLDELCQYDSSDIRIDQILSQARNLLYLLIGYKNGGDRYSDIVDISFYGIIDEERVNKNPLYERERPLVEDVYVSIDKILNYDQIDSFKLRYKILFTIYKTSTFYATDSIIRQYIHSGSDVDTVTSPIKSNNSTLKLLEKISKKLIKLDIEVIKIFFDTMVEETIKQKCSVHSMEFFLVILSKVTPTFGNTFDYKLNYQLVYYISEVYHHGQYEANLLLTESLETFIKNLQDDLDMEDYPFTSSTVESWEMNNFLICKYIEVMTHWIFHTNRDLKPVKLNLSLDILHNTAQKVIKGFKQHYNIDKDYEMHYFKNLKSKLQNVIEI